MSKEKRTRRSYTEEFKLDAVALVKEQHYKISEAARSLGIHDNLLRSWIAQTEEKATQGGVTLDEKEELKRLRKEVRELRMEKEILKKAPAFFAKEMK